VNRRHQPPVIGFLPWGDRFETFHDKIGVSIDTFRDAFTGGWLFNYVDALRSVGVRTVIVFGSDRISRPVRFRHVATGAHVSILPAPRLHNKVRHAHTRFLPRSGELAAVASYLATPLVAVARELRRQQCDAILCQEYEYPRFDIGVVLGKLLRLPVFATYQGGNETTSLIERSVRGVTVRHCSGLIIAARDEALRVRKRYRIPSRKIAHIPNPVDVASWRGGDRNASRAELGFSQHAKVVVWHGHMEPRRKGLDVLLDAWEVIRSRRPESNLVLFLIGRGRHTAALSGRIGSDPTIRWIDRFVHNRRELRCYLSAADVYTLPSRHEGFAVAPLEAMACSLPVVVTDVSGVKDLLRGEGDGGLIVPPANVPALAGALLRVLDQPGLARILGARARQRVENQFSLEVVGPRLRRLLFPDR
jgi:glycosyltransferase involved in cell wall biosynthesis